MDTNILKELANLIESCLKTFRYSDSVLMIPFGINIVAMLLNVESIFRYGRNNRIFYICTVILCFLFVVIYKLNLVISSETTLTDGWIVLISVALIIGGIILSLTPLWALNKKNLEK